MVRRDAGGGVIGGAVRIGHLDDPPVEREGQEAGHRVPAHGERHPGGQPGGADDRVGQGDQGVQGGPARVGRQDVEP